MNHSRLARAVVGVAFVCLTHGSDLAAAEADRIAEGRSHFARGVEYYKEEDYRNAMVEFKRAYELAPNYKLLYNLGQTGQELRDYAFALKSLEQYLAEGGKELTAERRAEVNEIVRKLKQRVAEVTIRTNSSGADVMVDETVVGRTPLAGPVVVSAGNRKITLTKGSVNASRSIEVAGGEHAELTLDLNSSDDQAHPAQREHAPSAPASARDQRASPGATRLSQGPDDGKSDGNTATWVGVITTGALAVATGVVGGLAIAAKHDYDTTLDKYPIAPGDVADARSETRKRALAADILGAATLLSGGITIWVALSNNHRDSNASGNVGVTVTPTALIARGEF
jgi:tetratricopeptide (TPR) repeat protein